PDQPGLHAAGATQARVRVGMRGRAQPALARRGTALLLSLHRPREPDFEWDLSSDRLSPGRRRDLDPIRLIQIPKTIAATRNRGDRCGFPTEQVHPVGGGTIAVVARSSGCAPPSPE